MTTYYEIIEPNNLSIAASETAIPISIILPSEEPVGLLVLLCWGEQ